MKNKIILGLLTFFMVFFYTPQVSAYNVGVDTVIPTKRVDSSAFVSPSALKSFVVINQSGQTRQFSPNTLNRFTDNPIVSVIGTLPSSGNSSYKGYFAKENNGNVITAYVDSSGNRHAYASPDLAEYALKSDVLKLNNNVNGSLLVTVNDTVNGFGSISELYNTETKEFNFTAKDANEQQVYQYTLKSEGLQVGNTLYGTDQILSNEGAQQMAFGRQGYNLVNTFNNSEEVIAELQVGDNTVFSTLRYYNTSAERALYVFPNSLNGQSGIADGQSGILFLKNPANGTVQKSAILHTDDLNTSYSMTALRMTSENMYKNMPDGSIGIIPRFISNVPTIASSPGEFGDMAIDNEFLYVKTANGSWKKISLIDLAE